MSASVFAGSERRGSQSDGSSFFGLFTLGEIGFASDNRVSSQLLVSGWVFPSFPQADERKNSGRVASLAAMTLEPSFLGRE
jgi:hypothetical protein